VSKGCKLRGSGTVHCTQASATTPADTLRLVVATRDALTAAAGLPATLGCTPAERALSTLLPWAQSGAWFRSRLTATA
jgi:hypothetical protein